MKAWDHHPFSQIIIVEDNPTKTFPITKDISRIHHYSWKEIDESLGGDSWIISRCDAAIRNFGFWIAWKSEADYIFSLDDDCIPSQESGSSFMFKHLEVLNNTPRWCGSIVNQRTRGLPYYNQGVFANIVLSHGLWEGVPDFDAVQTLGGRDPYSPDRCFPMDAIELPQHNRLLAQGQYFPMCGMNICFKRDITPLMYFALMGKGEPYRRFEDIWCGVISKKVCDHLGLLVSVGKPFVFHSRASNPFVNLVKEAPGIEVNEVFWEKIDSIPLSGDTPVKCMIEIGNGLQTESDDYLQHLGKAIIIWAQLFQSNE
jgi:reversibly glycosylated polypeptide/UDP-arabinopyranose mutase